MTTKNQYFRGRGTAKIAMLDADGVPLGYRRVGNCPEMKLEATVETMEHEESETGQDMTDVKFTTKKKLKVSMTLEDYSDENLAMAMHGQITEDLGTGTFTKTLAGPFVAGLSYRFGNVGYKITTITDSSVVPVVIAATEYTVDADGTVAFKDPTALVAPLTVVGPKAASTSISLLGASAPTVALLVNGMNTLDDNSPLVVSLSRLYIDPANGGIDLFGKEIGKLQITGECLYDPNDATGTGIMKGFGSITRAKKAA